LEKHHKNVKDNHVSVRLIRVSKTGRDSGNLIFLAEDKIMAVFALQYLSKHGAPPNFTIIVPLSAFMTDEVWMKVAPVLAKKLKICWEVL